MIRMLLAALAAFLLAGASATEPSAGNVEVTVRLTSDGVRAEFVLDRPVQRFAFARADVVRSGEFELLTTGLSFAEDAVTGTPFRRFELLVRPMSRERDAKYPAHFRLGEGGVLYGPALKGDGEAWQTRFLFETAPGETMLAGVGGAGDGFVFIGPASLVSEDERIMLVADPAAPQWLVERARTALAAAVETFEEALGLPLPAKPLLIVSYQEGERSFNVGDVTPGAVAALRFHGPAWRQPDDRAGRNIQIFILHEAFHFWNGVARAPGTPAWLHEGSAEYAALLAARRVGILDDEDVRLRLSEALGRCRSALQMNGDRAISEFDFLPSQVRYPCGMVLHWAADLRLRVESGGRRTVMHGWAEMLHAARSRTPVHYGLADFHAAAGITGGEEPRPLALLLNESGSERWRALPTALNSFGADVRTVPSAPGRRTALLFHLLRRNCRHLPPDSAFGFWTENGAIKLQSPEGCGAIAGDPVLQSVEGGDPFDMPLETYEAARRRCAAGKPVRLLLADGRTVEAACDEPLQPAPEEYSVERWIPAAI